MKFSLFIILIFPFTTYAGTFGSVTLKGLTYGHDQSGCDAEDIIIDEYNRTNIDFVEGTAPYKWDCDGVTSAEAQEKRCPYAQNVKNGMGNLRCFSNSKTGPAVCVSGASFKEKEETYGFDTLSGTKTSKVTRARFKELFTLTETTGKYRNDKLIKMDPDGCKTQEVRDNGKNGTIVVSKERCTETLKNLLGGSEIEYSNPKQKYCDPELRDNYDYVSGMLGSVRMIGDCLRLIPNFGNDYTREMLERRSSDRSREKSSNGKSSSAVSK